MRHWGNVGQAIGGIAMLAGAFLPWVTASAGYDELLRPLSIAGVQGPAGIVVAILGLVTAILAVAALWNRRRLVTGAAVLVAISAGALALWAAADPGWARSAAGDAFVGGFRANPHITQAQLDAWLARQSFSMAPALGVFLALGGSILTTATLVVPVVARLRARSASSVTAA